MPKRLQRSPSVPSPSPDPESSFFRPRRRGIIGMPRNNNSDYDAFNPKSIDSIIWEGLQKQYGPIRKWLKKNLRRYAALGNPSQIIRALKKIVPQAKELSALELKSIIQQEAKKQGLILLWDKTSGDEGPESPDLSELTKFQFDWGATSWDLEIPTSLKFKLPHEFRGARKITFALSAYSSGKFEFGISLDATRHIQVSSITTGDVGGNRFKTGLQIIARRTVCRAKNPALAKSEIIAKGKKLTKTINELQTMSKAKSKGNKLFDLNGKYIEVIGEIVSMYGTVKDLEKPCSQVPFMSFGFEWSEPLDPIKESQKDIRERKGSTAGFTITFPF